GIRDGHVTGVQTCALPISRHEQQTPGNDGDRARLSAQVLAEVLDRTGDEKITVLSTVQGLGGRHGVEDDSEVAAAAVAALEPRRSEERRGGEGGRGQWGPE